MLLVLIKDGFNFVGWFIDVDKIILFEVIIMLLGNIIFYVLW